MSQGNNNEELRFVLIAPQFSPSEPTSARPTLNPTPTPRTVIVPRRNATGGYRRDGDGPSRIKGACGAFFLIVLVFAIVKVALLSSSSRTNNNRNWSLTKYDIPDIKLPDYPKYPDYSNFNYTFPTLPKTPHRSPNPWDNNWLRPLGGNKFKPGVSS